MLAVDLNLRCSQAQQAAAFREFLGAQATRGSTTVLIINNSQRLGLDVFHEIQRLNDLQGSQRPLLQTVLIASPEIEQKFRSPELLGFQRRIQIRTNLETIRG
jgi:type II secretory pathway predicted ATPase ExeA